MALYEGDLKAGLTGLVLGVILLFAVTVSIVMLTNASHAKHPAPAAGAAPAHQAAPAAGTAPTHQAAPAGGTAPTHQPAPAGSH